VVAPSCERDGHAKHHAAILAAPGWRTVSPAIPSLPCAAIGAAANEHTSTQYGEVGRTPCPSSSLRLVVEIQAFPDSLNPQQNSG